MQKITPARTIRRRLTKALKDSGEYWPELAPLIDAVSTNSEIAQKASLEIEEAGILVEGYRGGMVKNPAFAIKRQAEQNIFLAYRELKNATKGRKTDTKDGGAIAMIRDYLNDDDL